MEWLLAALAGLAVGGLISYLVARAPGRLAEQRAQAAEQERAAAEQRAQEASQALHSGGYYSNYLDLTSEYAGALSGFGNTLATGLGSIGTLFMPVIIYT